MALAEVVQPSVSVDTIMGNESFETISDIVMEVV